MYHDPFFFAYELTRDLNLVTYRSINNVLSVDLVQYSDPVPVQYPHKKAIQPLTATST